ncbi:hypothetical protein DL96DRAFT_1627268, partial [Flagelloscypha sp. PMI_526]
MDASRPFSSLMPAKEPLPLEIIIIILDLVLQCDSTYDIMFEFSLLSRPIYYWIIPRLYHTLDLDERSTTSSIDRAYFLESAEPSYFIHTRRLISRVSRNYFPFSLFSQLSHLSLWGHNYLEAEPNGPTQAQEIVMLPLEELFIWEVSDNRTLLRKLTEDVTIWRTLQRFGCHVPSIRGFPHEGWMSLPNLVQVLVLFGRSNWFVHTAGWGIPVPSSPKFKLFALAPLPWVHGETPTDAVNTIRLRDRRIVVLLNPLPHLFTSAYCFWSNNHTMWQILLEEIEMNEEIY